jgi:hypothetical protein
MKKIVISVLLAVGSINVAQADTGLYPVYLSPISLFAEAKQNDARLNDSGVDLKLQGLAIGISTSPYRHGFWAALDLLRDDKQDFDYAEVRVGGHLNLFSQDGFYLIGTLGVGFANASSSQLYNDVQFVTIPVGLEAGYKLIPNVNLYGGVGYKWQREVTADKTCNDGTVSNSSCRHHDGLYAYNDQVGDADGTEFKLGVRVSF